MTARLMHRLAGGREKRTSASSGESRKQAYRFVDERVLVLPRLRVPKPCRTAAGFPIILRSARVTPDCERFYGATSFASGRWRKAGFPASPRSLGHLAQLVQPDASTSEESHFCAEEGICAVQ